MMTKQFMICLSALSFCCGLYSQVTQGPYSIKTSEEFRIPRRHRDLLTLDYGPMGTLQVYNKGLKSFGFWLFDQDLKIKKQKIVETKDFFDGRVRYNSFIDLRTRSYLFVREVFRETSTEGITALPFSHDALEFKGPAKNLFQSSDKVIDGYEEAIVSEDRSKVMFCYTLRREEKDDKINKDVMGFHVYDENLVKLWGGEYEMPYTEAVMSVVDRTITDDGRFILLAKIYGNDSQREQLNGRPNYHYELLSYSGSSKRPNIIRIDFDMYFAIQSLIYEDNLHQLVVTGFYSKSPQGFTDGAYMAKLNNSTDPSHVQPYYYEIPNNVIKAYTSEREQEKVDRNVAKGRELGIPNLKFRKTFFMEDSTTILIAEQYNVVVNTYYNGRTTTYTYDTYANDIYILKFDAVGNVIWVNKIGKAQHSSDASGVMLSFNAVPANGGVNIFFIDNIKNADLPVTEFPYMHQQGRGGYFTGVNIDKDGYMKHYNLGEMKGFDSGFNIRYFDLGNHHNLLGSGRKGKNGFVYSIGVK